MARAWDQGSGQVSGRCAQPPLAQVSSGEDTPGQWATATARTRPRFLTNWTCHLGCRSGCLILLGSGQRTNDKLRTGGPHLPLVEPDEVQPPFDLFLICSTQRPLSAAEGKH